MSINKPFTFIAGTKARSGEVNENFDVLYSQVNSNITEINDNNNDIARLDSTKADINGNASQRFSVANAVNGTDAINKQTLHKLTTNTEKYISGLRITRNSASPNDTIIVSPGSCYDSKYETMLVLPMDTSKKNESQSASTTYYVYIIGDGKGNKIDVFISTSQIEPPLPSGYTLYRAIGWLDTNSNGNIESINSYTNEYNIASIRNNIAPDYKKAIAISLPYTVKKFGYYMDNHVHNQGYGSIYINGFKVSGWGPSANVEDTTQPMIVSIGDVITKSGAGLSNAYFIPTRGEA